MVQFNCTSCNKQLMVPDEYSGKEAKCPKCGQMNAVPNSQVGNTDAVDQFIPPVDAEDLDAKKDGQQLQNRPPKLSIWRRDIFGRPPKKRTASMRYESSPYIGYFFGCLFIGASVIVTYLAVGMDIAGGHDPDIGTVVNLDKMNQRLGFIVIGVGLFLSGIIALSVNAIHATVWKMVWTNQWRQRGRT